MNDRCELASWDVLPSVVGAEVVGGQHCRWARSSGGCEWGLRSGCTCAIMLLAVSSDAKRCHGWVALLRMIADAVVDSLTGRADVLGKEWELLNDAGVYLGLQGHGKKPNHLLHQHQD